MPTPIVEVKNLAVRYGGNLVFGKVNFEIQPGDYVGLSGPNGSGKTTLMKAVLGLIPTESGTTVRLFGVALPDFSDWRRIGYLSQRANTFNPLFPATVREAVGLGLLAGKRLPRRLNRDDRARVEETLAGLGVADLADRQVATLSGGQQQRVFLARALVSRPELLVLDEPSTALDSAVRSDFFDIVEKLNRQDGITIVLITHDLHHIAHHANRLLYVDKGAAFFGTFGEFCGSEETGLFFGHHAQHLICQQQGNVS